MSRNARGYGLYFSRVSLSNDIFKSLFFQPSRTYVRARSRPDDDSPSDDGPPPGPSGRTRLR